MFVVSARKSEAHEGPGRCDVVTGMSHGVPRSTCGTVTWLSLEAGTRDGEDASHVPSAQLPAAL